MRPPASLPSSMGSPGSVEEVVGPPTPPSGERKGSALGLHPGKQPVAVQAQPAAAKVDYAALYRERFRRERAEEQATALRRLRR